MLNVLKERLPEGMEIKSVKERRSKYEIVFMISGGEIKEELPKTCTPGRQERVADHTIFNAMCKAEISKGNFLAAKEWLDRILEVP